MAQLNFPFVPIPWYFFNHGWMNDPESCRYICWAFSRCSSTSRKFHFLKKEITLDAFEYISGHTTCTIEAGLSRQQMRTQAFSLVEAKLLEKSTIKSTSKYSVYRWNTAAFLEKNNHQNNQQPTSSQPAANHNQDIQDIQEEKKERATPSGINGNNVFTKDVYDMIAKRTYKRKL